MRTSTTSLILSLVLLSFASSHAQEVIIKSIIIQQVNQNLRGGPVVLGTLSINAPLAGKVEVQFNGNCVSAAGDRILLAASNTTNWAVNDGHVAVEAADSDVNRHSFSHTRAYNVGAGSTSFHAVGQNFVETEGSGVASVYGMLVVKYYPELPGNAVQPRLFHTGVIKVNQDLNGPVKEIASLSAFLPTSGKVSVRFDGMCVSDPGDLIVIAASNNIGWSVNAGNTQTEAIDEDLNTRVFSHTQTYTVGAGTHTFYGVAQNFVETGGDGFASFYGSLTIEYYPDGPQGSPFPTVKNAVVNRTSLAIEGAPVTVASVVCNAPTSGKVQVTFDCLCAGSPGDRNVMAASNVEDWSSNSGNVNVEAFSSDLNYNNASHSRVYDVGPGNHTFYAVLENSVETTGSGIASFYGHLTVKYFPDPLAPCSLFAWATDLGLSDHTFDGDEDGDKIVNGLERAFGGHGGVHSHEIAPGIPLLPEAITVPGGRNGPSFAMRYLLRSGHLSDCFNYTLQFSRDGVAWFNANRPGLPWTNTLGGFSISSHATADGGIVRRIVVPMASPINNSVDNLLGRVVVTENP